MEIQIIQDKERCSQTQVVYPDLQHGETNFHYKVYDSPAGTKSPYLAHWHSEYEIALVLDGVVDFIVDGTLYHLKPDEVLFFNSNSVHGHASLDAVCGHYISFVFGENFIFPDAESYIYNCVFAPIHMGKYTFTKHITGNCTYEKEIISIIKQLASYRNNILENALPIQICLLQIFHIMTRENVFDLCEEKFSKNELVKTALWYIKKNYILPISVNDIAKFLNISSDYFGHLFKENVGSTPKEYIQALRIRHAIGEMNKNGAVKMADVATASGFSEPNYFARVFKSRMGVTPSEYQKYLRNAEPIL